MELKLNILSRIKDIYSSGIKDVYSRLDLKRIFFVGLKMNNVSGIKVEYSK